jgi:hypothetical protein
MFTTACHRHIHKVGSLIRKIPLLINSKREISDGSHIDIADEGSYIRETTPNGIKIFNDKL